MRGNLRNPAMFLASATALGLLLSAGSADAQVECGDTITGKITMTQDLDCTDVDADPSITIDGGTLDMNGFELLGHDSGDRVGVEFVNAGGELVNGEIFGASVGIVLGGSGKHKLLDVVVDSSSSGGIHILVGADKNKLHGVLVKETGESGFRIESEKNSLTDCTAVRSNDAGIEIVGAANKLSRCMAIASGSDGFVIDGADTKIKFGSATQNDDSGFLVHADDVQLSRCAASSNLGDGFDVEAQRLKVKDGSSQGDQSNGVRIRQNSAGISLTKVRIMAAGAHGIRIDGGTDITVKGSIIQANGLSGIRNNAGTDLSISGNSVTGHIDDDLYEGVTKCATNTWKGNTFFASNLPCID